TWSAPWSDPASAAVRSSPAPRRCVLVPGSAEWDRPAPRRRHLYIGFMTSPESAASRPELAPDTIVVETGRPNRADGASVNPAIDLSSTFISTGDIESSPFAYARFDTPAWSHFE